MKENDDASGKKQKMVKESALWQKKKRMII